jgi:outer membrane protein insertion porin family
LDSSSAPRFGLALLFAISLGGLPQPISAQTIAEIRVKGNARVEESLIFDSFGVNAGEPYQIDKVRKGVRNLYRQGLFESIDILGETTPEGLVLTIELRENPTLQRVRYEGADKLDEDDFREVVELTPGQVVSRRDVAQARRDILDLYEEKGYLLAEVTPELPGESRVDLVFHIEEGKKVQVERIRFTGQSFVSEGALRDVMETKEDRWWRGGDFKREVFDEDQKRIVARMGREGFVDARVLGHTLSFSENKERLFLDIEVAEGPRYRVGRILLDHGGKIEENRIRTEVLLEEGEPFDTGRFDETMGALYSLFQEQGYIYARIDAEKTPHEGNVIDVEFHVLEGDPARINRILITGNTKTKEKVIRRELTASPGDVFKRSRVMRSQREVFQLGFFNDIQLDSRTADPETGAIDLVLNVEERQTGTASLGAGVNSQAGLTGFLQLSQNNFLGNGQLMSVRGEFGRFREFELSFTEPWLFDTPTTAGADLYDTRRRYTEYVEKRRGGDLRLGRPFPWLDYTTISASYSLGEYRIEAEPDYRDEIGDPVIDPETGEQVRDPVTGRLQRTGESEDLISAVTLTIARNSVDSPFFPTRGSATRFRNEFGGGILGGDAHYHLATFTAQSYFRTVGKFVLSLSGEIGFLNGFEDADNVPFWKRFRLGGISRYGLRGYDDFEVVPDPARTSTGGRSMLITTAEMRYPVVQAVQALAFFDVGNTWASPGETDLTGLKRGAGLGVRIDVPMVGQLGFDYGYGFDRAAEEGGPGWEFHFQIGGQRY